MIISVADAEMIESSSSQETSEIRQNQTKIPPTYKKFGRYCFIGLATKCVWVFRFQLMENFHALCWPDRIFKDLYLRYGIRYKMTWNVTSKISLLGWDWNRDRDACGRKWEAAFIVVGTVWWMDQAISWMLGKESISWELQSTRSLPGLQGGSVAKIHMQQEIQGHSFDPGQEDPWGRGWQPPVFCLENPHIQRSLSWGCSPRG